MTFSVGACNVSVLSSALNKANQRRASYLGSVLTKCQPVIKQRRSKVMNAFKVATKTLMCQCKKWCPLWFAKNKTQMVSSWRAGACLQWCYGEQWRCAKCNRLNKCRCFWISMNVTYERVPIYLAFSPTLRAWHPPRCEVISLVINHAKWHTTALEKKCQAALPKAAKTKMKDALRACVYITHLISPVQPKICVLSVLHL